MSSDSSLPVAAMAFDARIGHLRALLAVVAEGSVSAGARRLGMAQPTLTRAIKQFELSLGMPVLARGPGGLELTELGRLLLPHARRLVRAHEKVQEAAAQLAGSVEGTVTIAMSALPRLLLLPEASRALWKRFPHVHLEIGEGTYPHVLRQFEAAALDFAMCPAPPDQIPSTFESQTLLEVQLAVTMRAGHPLRSATSLAELVGCQWIAAGPPFGLGLREAFEAHQLPAPHSRIHCESLDHALRLVAQSDMMTLAPATVVSRSPLAATLHQPRLRQSMAPLSVALLLPRQRALSPAAEQLIDALRSAASRCATAPW
jgi:LysR family transcriptional regulator of abg operon